MTATPEQLDSAFTYCIDFARTMLNKRGEFYPFGAAINKAGQVVAQAAWTGDEHPNSQDVYAVLLSALRAQLSSGNALGIAVAVDVNIPPDYGAVYPDGLRVTLESKGYARLIYVPYRITRQGIFRSRVVDFAEPFAVEVPASE